VLAQRQPTRCRSPGTASREALNETIADSTRVGCGALARRGHRGPGGLRTQVLEPGRRGIWHAERRERRERPGDPPSPNDEGAQAETPSDEPAQAETPSDRAAQAETPSDAADDDEHHDAAADDEHHDAAADDEHVDAAAERRSVAVSPVRGDD
jgi:hypothetical protein